MFTLKNWHVSAEAGGVITEYGECFDNPRFYQGYYVRTSPVLRITANDENKCLYLYTCSSSCYRVEYAEASKELLEDTMWALQSHKIEFDEENWRRFICEKEEDVKSRLSGVLAPDGLYVKMIGGWGVLCAYFKAADGSVVSVPVSVHTSAFSTDSILVSDWGNGLCDFRIFPYGAEIVPYHWSDGLGSVSIENIGDDFIFRGSNRDILCKHGEVTTIKSEDYWGEGLLSPDAVNGKGVFTGRGKRSGHYGRSRGI